MPASIVCTISVEVVIALRDLLDAVRANTSGGHFRISMHATRLPSHDHFFWFWRSRLLLAFNEQRWAGPAETLLAGA